MKSHKKFQVGLTALLVPALMAGLTPARANAASLVVTSTDDAGVGGCTSSSNGDGCTLREAITAANDQTLTPGDDTIDASGISGIITLDNALPPLATNIVLNGPGAASLTVQRNSALGTPEFRIFSIDNTTTTGPTVVLSGFTIAGGKVSGTETPANSGGGIYNNHGTLTVRNSVLKNNSATNGGAICNDGSLSVNATLTLSGSTLITNTAGSGGGGLFNNGSGGGSALVAISNSIFSGNGATSGGAILNDGRTGGSARITALSNSVLSSNTASGNGGGIENNGISGGSATLVISRTTLDANTAANGGGIDNDGTAGSATQAISYSTFNANTASSNGGAINNDGRAAGSATLAVGTSTFNANSAAKGGAILNNGTGGSATVEIDNSTLKANAIALDSSGTDKVTSGFVSSAAIDSDGTAGSATLALGSTILDNGPTANLKLTVNSETTFTSKNHNLSSDAAGGDGTTAPGGPYFTAGNDIRNTDPKLDPAGLQDNGGPTATIRLLSSSPAINQGLSSFPTDQRGYGFFGAPDIGAFEFAGVAPANVRPVNGSIAPNGNITNAIGEERTFRATYSDANGFADIKLAYLEVGSSSRFLLRGAYVRQSNKLYLLNDLGTGYIGGFAPGSANVISNFQGTLNCATTFVTPDSTGDANTLQIDWSLTAKSALANTPKGSGALPHPVRLYVTDQGSLSDGYDQGATWTIGGNIAPQNVSLSPGGTVTNAIGQARTFRATYSDVNGYSNIRYAFLQVRTGPNQVLRASYDVLNNRLYLLKTDRSDYDGGITPGTDTVLSNSLGSLSCKLTKPVGAGNTLRIDWVIAASSALAGSSHPVLLYVQDRGNLTDGFDQGATWQIASQ